MASVSLIALATTLQMNTEEKEQFGVGAQRSGALSCVHTEERSHDATHRINACPPASEGGSNQPAVSQTVSEVDSSVEVFFVRVVLIFNVQISRYSHCFTVKRICEKGLAVRGSDF